MSKNAEGWIRHRGSKCPVEKGTLIDVRFRNGDIVDGVKALERDGGAHVYGWCAGVEFWKKDDVSADIMAYRLHKPAEQIEADKVMRDCVEKCASTESAGELLYDQIAQGPLQWRDRITDLDEERKTIDALYQVNTARIETERAELVQKLAGEGFALIGRVVEPVEDVSCRNIKAGDTVVFVKESNGDFTNGRKYNVLSVDSSFAPYNVIDDEGDENCLSVEECAFYSRPSA